MVEKERRKQVTVSATVRLIIDHSCQISLHVLSYILLIFLFPCIILIWPFIPLMYYTSFFFFHLSFSFDHTTIHTFQLVHLQIFFPLWLVPWPLQWWWNLLILFSNVWWLRGTASNFSRVPIEVCEVPAHNIFLQIFN